MRTTWSTIIFCCHLCFVGAMAVPITTSTTTTKRATTSTVIPTTSTVVKTHRPAYITTSTTTVRTPSRNLPKTLPTTHPDNKGATQGMKDTSSGQGSPKDNGLIIGASIGAVVFVILLSIIVILILRIKRRRSRLERKHNDVEGMVPSQQPPVGLPDRSHLSVITEASGQYENIDGIPEDGMTPNRQYQNVENTMEKASRYIAMLDSYIDLTSSGK